jgi:tetratricopeptide (TPR) repeat protein
MGYLCFIFWVLFGGACGGLIYSLTTDSTHQLRVPFYRKNRRYVDIETGCLGHIFIGAFSGLLLITIVIHEFAGDIAAAVQDTAGPFTAAGPLGKVGLQSVLYSLCISLIGGFLGLKLITRVAAGALQEIDNKIEKLRGKVHQQEDEAAIFGHTVLARALINENELGAAAQEVEKSLKIRPTKFAEFVNALVLSRQGDFEGAVAALDRALALPPDKMAKNDPTLHWNKACYLAQIDPDKYLPQIINELDVSIESRPGYRGDVATEEQLGPVLDKPDFRKHFGLG